MEISFVFVGLIAVAYKKGFKKKTQRKKYNLKN